MQPAYVKNAGARTTYCMAKQTDYLANKPGKQAKNLTNAFATFGQAQKANNPHTKAAPNGFEINFNPDCGDTHTTNTKLASHLSWLCLTD